MKNIDLLSAIGKIDDELISAAEKGEYDRESETETVERRYMDVHQENMDTSTRTSKRNRKNLLVPGLLALAAVTVLVVVILKLVPSLNAPVGDQPQAENSETRDASENDTENSWNTSVDLSLDTELTYKDICVSFLKEHQNDEDSVYDPSAFPTDSIPEDAESVRISIADDVLYVEYRLQCDRYIIGYHLDGVVEKTVRPQHSDLIYYLDSTMTQPNVMDITETATSYSPLFIDPKQEEKTEEQQKEALRFLNMADENYQNDLIRTADFINAQGDPSYTAAPENIQKNVAYLLQHRTELVFNNEDEQLLINKYLQWHDQIYGYGYTDGEIIEAVANEAETLPYIDALTEEDKEMVLSLAEEQYRLLDGKEEAEALAWFSYDIYEYQDFTSRIGQKKPEPGKCIVVCVNEKEAIGSVGYMVLSYMKTADDSDWELVNCRNAK